MEGMLDVILVCSIAAAGLTNGCTLHDLCDAMWIEQIWGVRSHIKGKFFLCFVVGIFVFVRLDSSG